ncbi:MAG: hypothetical protein AAGD22_15215 [Verrucomicrobiota bacterium]
MNRGVTIALTLALGATVVVALNSCRASKGPRKMPYVETTPSYQHDPQVQAAIDREIARREAQVDTALNAPPTPTAR